MADTALRAPHPAPAVIGESLHERVLFTQAQGILVGLTGCSPDRAAHSLSRVAHDLGMSPGEVARRLMRCVTTDDDRAGPIMAGLAVSALRPESDGFSD
jgi:hypothetical protein